MGGNIKISLTMSFFILLYLLSGCSKDLETYNNDARAVLEDLDKIRASVEVGINYQNFSAKLADANYRLSNFSNKYKTHKKIANMNSFNALTRAGGCYIAAVAVWDAKVKEQYSDDLEYALKKLKYDGLINVESTAAALFIKYAKDAMVTGKEDDAVIATKLSEITSRKDELRTILTTISVNNEHLPQKLKEMGTKMESFGSL